MSKTGVSFGTFISDIHKIVADVESANSVDGRSKFVILDNDKQLKHLYDMFDALYSNNTYYLNDVENRSADFYDRIFGQVNSDSKLNLFLIFSSEISPEMVSDFLNKFYEKVNYYYNMEDMISSVWVKLTVIITFRYEQRTYYQESAKKFSECFNKYFNDDGKVNNGSIFPDTLIIHLFSKCYNDVCLNTAFEKIVLMASSSYDMLAPIKSECMDTFSHQLFKKDDYPWAEMEITETHVFETILLKYLKKKLENLCNKQFVVNEQYVTNLRSLFLNYLGINDMRSVKNMLKTCCEYVPVSIDKEEWINGYKEVESRTNTNKPKKWFWNFGRKNDTFKSSTEKEQTPLNDDKEAVKSKYIEYIREVMPKTKFFNIMFERFPCVIEYLTDSNVEKFRNGLLNSIEKVFQPDEMSAFEDLKNDYYSYVQNLPVDKFFEKCKALKNTQNKLLMEDFGNLIRSYESVYIVPNNIENILDTKLNFSNKFFCSINPEDLYEMLDVNMKKWLESDEIMRALTGFFNQSVGALNPNQVRSQSQGTLTNPEHKYEIKAAYATMQNQTAIDGFYRMVVSKNGKKISKMLRYDSLDHSTMKT